MIEKKRKGIKLVKKIEPGIRESLYDNYRRCNLERGGIESIDFLSKEDCMKIMYYNYQELIAIERNEKINRLLDENS